MHEEYVEGEKESDSQNEGDGHTQDAIGAENRGAGVSGGGHGKAVPSKERAGSQDGVKRKKVAGGAAERITVCIDDSDDD